MVDKTHHSVLSEQRFQQPAGWRWHSFERNGRRMRFGSAFPKDSIPDAVIVCVQGVREFSEKYFETARWALDNNFAFWIFDWVGQGKSTRYLKNPEKRHAEDFSVYVEDLHNFILGYIKHSSVHPDKGRIPMALLAHSMGANIALRFLHKYPNFFECAALSSPMLGLKVFENIPQSVGTMAAGFMNLLAGQAYIPKGQDWVNLPPPPDQMLSGDPVRSLVHNLWLENDPELRCGDVTYGWVYHAQKSCIYMQNENICNNITTPLLIGIPEHEHLVDNRITKNISSWLPHAQVLELPNSYHEILMEKDDIRSKYLDNFYNLIKERIIKRPETLKPF